MARRSIPKFTGPSVEEPSVWEIPRVPLSSSSSAGGPSEFPSVPFTITSSSLQGSPSSVRSSVRSSTSSLGDIPPINDEILLKKWHVPDLVKWLNEHARNPSETWAKKSHPPRPEIIKRVAALMSALGILPEKSSARTFVESPKPRIIESVDFVKMTAVEIRTFLAKYNFYAPSTLHKAELVKFARDKMAELQLQTVEKVQPLMETLPGSGKATPVLIPASMSIIETHPLESKDTPEVAQPFTDLIVPEKTNEKRVPRVRLEKSFPEE